MTHKRKMLAREINGLTRRFLAEWNKGKEAAMTVMSSPKPSLF